MTAQGLPRGVHPLPARCSRCSRCSCCSVWHCGCCEARTSAAAAHARTSSGSSSAGREWDEWAPCRASAAGVFAMQHVCCSHYDQLHAAVYAAGLFHQLAFKMPGSHKDFDGCMMLLQAAPGGYAQPHANSGYNRAPGPQVSTASSTQVSATHGMLQGVRTPHWHPPPKQPPQLCLAATAASCRAPGWPVPQASPPQPPATPSAPPAPPTATVAHPMLAAA